RSPAATGLTTSDDGTRWTPRCERRNRPLRARVVLLFCVPTRSRKERDMTTRPSSRRANGPVLFAELSLVAAATALVGVVAYAFAADPPAASEPTVDAGADD